MPHPRVIILVEPRPNVQQILKSIKQTSFHPLSGFHVVLVWSYSALHVALASPATMRPDQLHSVAILGHAYEQRFGNFGEVVKTPVSSDHQRRKSPHILPRTRITSSVLIAEGRQEEDVALTLRSRIYVVYRCAISCAASSCIFSDGC